MTNEAVNTTHSTCEEIAPLLEKQLVRESMSEAERQIAATHLNTCKACQDFLTWTAGWPILSDQVVEETMLSLIEETTDRFLKGKRKQRNMVFAGIASAAVAASLIVLLVLPDSTAQTGDVSTPAALVEACLPTDVIELTAGVAMSRCAHRPVDTAVLDNGDIRVSLSDGAVGLSIDPNRPQKQTVSVVTRFGTAIVKGTVFTVHIEKSDARLEVLRGTVSVRSNDGSDSGFEVHGGNGTMLVEHRQFTLADPKTNPFYAKLFPPTASDDRLHSVTAMNGESPIDTIVDAGLDMDPASANTHAGRTRRRGVSLDELWTESRNCLISQDWQCAAANYRQILKNYAGRRESMAALISLAKIELRHLDKPDNALRHFSMYRTQYPNGPLQEEAVWGMAQSHRRLGNTQQELDVLQSFVRAYPKSSLAGKAANRIRDIESRKVN